MEAVEQDEPEADEAEHGGVYGCHRALEDLAPAPDGSWCDVRRFACGERVVERSRQTEMRSDGLRPSFPEVSHDLKNQLTTVV